MGVYVKGIKPPSACAGCPCYAKPYFGLSGSKVFATCVLTNKKVDWNGCGKPEWCPILEIKMPRDFLLEAKTLIEAEVENV